MAIRLLIPREVYEAMLGHAQAEAPNECVGMLAGTPDGRVIERYPLVNALASPQRFESEPRSMFAAENRRRERGLEFLAVYHSHPTSEATPSRTDLEHNYWPELMSIIISLASAAPKVRAFWLGASGYREEEFEIVPG